MNTGYSTTIQGRSAVDITALLFDGGLNRTPDDVGLNFFTSEAQAGVSFATIAGQITASVEFGNVHAGETRAQIIDDFYVASLGRHAESGGLSAYAGSNLSISDILLSITTSQESLNYNNIGLDRFESAAVNGSVASAMLGGLDNTPTPPTVVTVPGPTQTVYLPGDTVYVPVDRPVDTPDVHAESFGTLSATLTNGAGNFYFGDGTTRANGNVIVQDTSEGRGLTLALAVQPRQAAGDGSGKFAPDNVVLDGNEAHATIHVPAGPETTATGSFANVANRGAFNVDLTVGTLSGTLAQHLAAGDRVELGIDTDATAAVSLRYFDGYIDKAGLLQFNDRATGTPAITDNKGNDHVASNSEQLNFFQAAGVAALTPGAQFEVTLRDYAADGHLVAGVHDTIILGQPGTLAGTHLYA